MRRRTTRTAAGAGAGAAAAAGAAAGVGQATDWPPVTFVRPPRHPPTPTTDLEVAVSANDITVYWRPGCGFCASLLRGLGRSGLEFEQVDIWQDEDAAAFVRSVAGGNETVPTVRIGEVALVNPSSPDVLRTIAQELPDRLPRDYEPPTPGRVARAISRLLGG